MGEMLRLFTTDALLSAWKKSPGSKVPPLQVIVHRLEKSPGCQAGGCGNSVPQDVTNQAKQRREMDWTTGCSEVESLKMRHFCSDIKPWSPESESFSEEQELGKCLTEGRCFSPQPPAGSSSLSLHRTGMQHWRQGHSLIRQRSVQKRCKLTAAITQDGKCQPPLQEAKSTHRKSHA